MIMSIGKLVISKRLCQKWFSRMGVACLTIWYVAVATHVIHPVLDSLFPQTKLVASLDFPCALHQCGCRTAQQCRDHCCCFPIEPVATDCCDSEPALSQPIVVEVASFTSTHCQGQSSQEQSLLGQGVAPHLVSMRIVLAKHNNPVRGLIPHFLVPNSVTPGLLDKVPI